MELITVELDTSPKTFIVCIYIPPSCSESLQRIAVNYLDSIRTDIVVGDFNAPDIDWSTLTATTPYSLSLCNTIHNKNFKQLMNMPTHKQGNILDLIITNSLIPYKYSCRNFTV